MTNAPDVTPDLSGGRPDPFDSLRQMNQDDLQRVDRDVHDAFEKTLKQDTQTLTDALSKLFGDPQHMGYGGGQETRERVLRWDWQGHAFLLSSPKDAYVTLRIVPTAFADNYGKGDVVDRDELKAELAQRVKQSDFRRRRRHRHPDGQPGAQGLLRACDVGALHALPRHSRRHVAAGQRRRHHAGGHGPRRHGAKCRQAS